MSEYDERLEKINRLREEGEIVYKGRYDVSHTAAQARELTDGSAASLAGRVVLKRTFGKLLFATLQDRSGRIQFSLKVNDVGKETFDRWAKDFQLGDYVGLAGEMWTTQKGERTLGATELVVLSRAIRPLPEKWTGLTNQELRYRKRFLDLVSNEETRERFQMRSRMVSYIRRYLDDRDFLEVETPILQAAACGASARPFSTHHNSLDCDFYLRISPETYLKRLVVGGFERVYEIGKNFRNEGMDPSHLQEFTMLEWYVAFWNYRDNMTFVRELIQAVVEKFCGGLVVEYEGQKLDFSGEWPVVDYRDAVKEETGIDLHVVRDVETLKKEVKARGFDEGEDEDFVSYAGMVDWLYKKTVRPKLIQPMFLVHHPSELVPLARRSDEDGTRLDMFQVVVNTWEIVKAYSELVDPTEQRARLEEQMELRAAGDEESMMLEEDFLECMEYGMPPISGLGLGIDRFIALLTDSPTLRDVVLFPSMRPEGQ
ncbi:lysine--tRNA ligase [bacterium]|nr:lysine--tRNA ligase [bacterium]